MSADFFADVRRFIRGNPRSNPRESASSPSKSALRENIESLLWAVALALIIRTFIMAPFKIPSGSMRLTLIEGDRILVNKFIYRFQPPQHGDIIVFRFPEERKRSFIKRLVATGGETVEIRDGKVLVNGQPLDGAGIFHKNYYYNRGPYGAEHALITVPQDCYFVLGDNSSASLDSRFWGFVPRKLVIGRAMCIFWPLPRWRILH
ncbi:MAG: signal peptidase I [Candidatus Omnitrophica bacterium]|nr:signal peptidase I [Candidatus Omnitrophota bacterium]